MAVRSFRFGQFKIICQQTACMFLCPQVKLFNLFTVENFLKRRLTKGFYLRSGFFLAIQFLRHLIDNAGSVRKCMFIVRFGQVAVTLDVFCAYRKINRFICRVSLRNTFGKIAGADSSRGS